MESGYMDLIHTSINSKGSGTYQATVLSKRIFFEEHPEAKKQFHIHLIDSKTYKYGLWDIPVVEGVQMVQEGASVDEIIEHIQEWLEHARPVFVPRNLKCVKKSGRISPAAAFMGDAIGLKPLITFEDGEAKVISKARGEHKAIATLLDRCMKERCPDTNYVLIYGSNQDAFAELKKACAEVMDRPPMSEYKAGCIISINTGPNMVGILYRT